MISKSLEMQLFSHYTDIYFMGFSATDSWNSPKSYLAIEVFDRAPSSTEDNVRMRKLVFSGI